MSESPDIDIFRMIKWKIGPQSSTGPQCIRSTPLSAEDALEPSCTWTGQTADSRIGYHSSFGMWHKRAGCCDMGRSSSFRTRQERAAPLLLVAISGSERGRATKHPRAPGPGRPGYAAVGNTSGQVNEHLDLYQLSEDCLLLRYIPTIAEKEGKESPMRVPIPRKLR